MSEKKTKIVMITMFKNEASVIGRMLESCKPYVDYYVMQNNGSTDGTDQIAKDFLVDNELSGEIYEIDEGWIGFGYNRDHLIQYCQNNTDHGCDWILKMDCDETLEVYPDFDWSVFDNKDIQAFHIPSIAGTAVYYRAWMYNAKLPWRFNHDTCHETVYCEIPEIGSAFAAYDLPIGFNQVNSNEGQSWGVPTKFVSDALILEERLIRENTMTENLYHFWYIAKSYFDAFPCSTFPLGKIQQKEYARRAIFYFQEYIDFVHDYRNMKKPKFIDEMSYLGLIMSAESYRFLEEWDAAITTYNHAESFAPGRNDHIFGLAEVYEKLGKYNLMLEQTTLLMNPNRKNAFGTYCNFIDTSLYNDSPTGRVQQIHQKALELSGKNNVGGNNMSLPFFINQNKNKSIFVVDNFYSNPDEIRHYALNHVEYNEDLNWYKGLRSKQNYQPQGIKQVFEAIIGQQIVDFPDAPSFNGCFQITTAKDPQVYHYDQQKWAAIVYLTPNAPVQSGTRSHISKINGTRHMLDQGSDDAFAGNFYDSTKFDTVDVVGNIYNRLIIMDAQAFHSAGAYFGDTQENGRLTHLFFFD